MSTLGGVPLTAPHPAGGGSALAVELSSPPRTSEVHVLGDWEVELRSGSTHAVARTARSFRGAALVDEAIDIVHRALDLASITTADHLVTLAPADNHIAVETAAEGVTLRLQSLSDLGIAMGVEITQVHADGTVERTPPPPALQWVPAFRFFRLSQGSRDLFDAFRNLFLGLEALLDQLFPKRAKEGEKQWIKRSLGEAATRSHFSSVLLGSGSAPLEDLVDRIYDVRVHLFHAKTGRVLIPDERVSYLRVAETYPALLGIWSELLRGWMPTGRGSGVVTYGGFRHLIEASYVGATVALGRQPAGADPGKGTGGGAPVQWNVLECPAEIRELRPGRMAVIGRGAAQILRPVQPFNRLAVVSAGKQPLIAGTLPDLVLDGIDQVEVVAAIRLLNLGQPRTEFS
jgi:hypothetical protein